MDLDPNAFSDSPLFRELQRVLLSSSGPVNWELARQIGVAAAQEGRNDPAPDPADLGAMEEAVRVAELHVAGFTGLEPPTRVARVRVLRLADWIASATSSLRAFIEPPAERMAQGLTELTASAEAQAAEQGPFGGGLVAQLSPLLSGAQAGSVLGAVGAHAFSSYDIPLPRAGADELEFVPANIGRFAQERSLDRTGFGTHVAIHEVVHRFTLTRPKIRDRFESAFGSFFSGLRFDSEGVARKIGELDTSNPDAIQGLFEGEGGLMAAVLDDDQRIELGKIQALLAIAEGYAEHEVQEVGAQLLPESARIREALKRDRLERQGPGFEALVGIELQPRHEEMAASFCRTVVELTSEATLARMWEEDDGLPGLPELEEPRLWLARIA
jgi:putative hydrolase